MRLPLGIVLLSVLLVGSVLAQDSSEDSGTPKRVLKKYRVRRPVIVDDQGNVVRAGPRLRRVRVKNPNRQSLETAALVSSTPEIVSSTPQVTEQPLTRQGRIRGNPNSVTEAPKQIQQSQQQFHTNTYYEEQGVVEPSRTVPTFRQATSDANRNALLANVNYKTRGGGTRDGDDPDAKQKVLTTRNYSKINEDGSFTFGYEADDGSFKEETRGVDCVVRGKYGYIDPEGVRREFEYVSGNPCDPNDPNKDNEQELEDDEIERPSRPLLRQRVRPNELSENNIQQGLQQISEERLPEDQLATFVRPTPRQRRPQQQLQQGVVRQRVRITTPPPTYQSTTEAQPAYIIRQRPLSARPSFQEPSQSLDSDRSNFGRAFNFDSEVNRIASISRPQSQPQPLYEQAFRPVQNYINSPTPQPARQVFGNTAFQQFQEQAQLSPSPSPTSPTLRPNPIPSPSPQSNFGSYPSQLTYDPATGRYSSGVVQSKPLTNQEFELTQNLRAFVQPTPARPIPTQHTPFHFPAFGQQQQQSQPQQQQQQQQSQPQQQQQQQFQYYLNQNQQQQQPRPTSGTPSIPPQDPSQINQFLARHAYRVHQDQSTQTAPQPSVENLQFIPNHLRPGNYQTADIQRQEVREINLPTQSTTNNFVNQQGSTGQIDAFLRALNISV